MEDINEPVYKLDRYFTQLEQCGILRNLGGLLLGKFHRCGNGRTRRKLFESVAALTPGPVIAEIPFGHVFPRITVPVGATVAITEGGAISFERQPPRENLLARGG